MRCLKLIAHGQALRVVRATRPLKGCKPCDREDGTVVTKAYRWCRCCHWRWEFIYQCRSGYRDDIRGAIQQAIQACRNCDRCLWIMWNQPPGTAGPPSMPDWDLGAGPEPPTYLPLPPWVA